ncbi:MAG TPA: inner membrane protein YiaA [Acidobacteriaceae bacterium]|jgi:uncharacterized membrane protein YiaA|nr:inner membrane protein YiaA [Acidobacteriaceae bacterium]
MAQPYRKPSAAFVGASWFALVAGALTFCIGLWNSEMALSTKALFFTLLMYGLFSAVSVQKSVRDRLDGIPVTNIYYGLSWVSIMLCMLLTAVGLWNAALTLAEKGFYAMAYMLSLFAAITVQKNTRDSVGAESVSYEGGGEADLVR